MSDPDEISEKVARGQRAAAGLSVLEEFIDEYEKKYLSKLIHLQRSEKASHDAYVSYVGAIATLWDMRSKLQRDRDQGERAGEQLEG